MNESSNSTSATAPIFPLPEIVLFPRALLPLHVFEPRYVEMVGHLLSGDGVLAVALLREGYELLYHSRSAPIHSHVCIGRIVACEELEDGKYNILVLGDERARIVREFSDRAYRRARLEILHTQCVGVDSELSALRRKLRQAVEDSHVGEAETPDHWQKLFEAPLSLSEVTDIIASRLRIPSELRQNLLEQLDAPRRAAMLLEHLATLGAVERNRSRSESGSGARLN